MSVILEKFFAALPAAERELLLGYATADPLHNAFSKKRITHARISDQPLESAAAQKVWQELMQRTTPKPGRRAAYLHIPFCQTKCLYCGFFQNHYQEDTATAYVDHLIKELEQASDYPYLQNGLIHAVFIGGGTPSSLSPANISRLLLAVRKNLPLANDYELTLEGRINDLRPDKLEAWFAGGVNRISIGVQSFQTKLRQQLGRIDPLEIVVKNLQTASGYEQCSVIVDLIYGLPDQTMDLWEQDLEILDNLPVDGMDLYQLNVYENSALRQAITAGTISPAATTAQQAQMFAFASAWLDKRPYTRLSNRHWSKNSRERSLYNNLAKSGVEMFPFGSGGGGKLSTYRCMLQRSLPTYMQMVSQNLKPLMVMSRHHAQQSIYNKITFQLEQSYLDLNSLAASYGNELLELQWLLNLWEQRGLLKNNGVIYQLTVPGQFWIVNLTQTLLETVHYLFEGKLTPASQPIAAQG